MAVKAVLPFGQGQGEVVGRSHGVQFQWIELHVTVIGGLEQVLIGEHDLKDGRVTEVARGLQGLHHQLEGNVRVGEGVLSHRSGPGQQVAEAGIVVQTQTQGQGIDEEADERLQFRVDAIGHSCANDQIILNSISG